jgi:hypothetical protein
MVVLLLFIGGGLVVAAVAKVRFAAARMQCRNNLRQLGLVVADYHTSYGCFPQAALPNPALAPEARLSWLVSVQPFVEASPLYHQMDKAKGWDAGENRFAALAPSKLLACPGRREGPSLEDVPMPSSYVGCAGLGADAARLPSGDRKAGFFGFERKLARADIAGRAGTLLMVLETSRPEGSWTAAGAPTVRGLDADHSPYLGSGAQFGGLHPGGTNLLLADASVRFVSRHLRPDVLEALAVLHDGEHLTPIPDD